ncbi:MAG TPA: tetratricopeptide repeat protein [Opitutaceae bacterium]|nr:tetratricopeptide repeat protein [Opitutaceae bacterium]
MRGRMLALTIACLGIALLGGCSAEARRNRALKRGDEFVAKNQYDRAEIEYINALRDDAQNAHAMASLGVIYMEQGRLSRAYPLLKRASEIDPNDLRARAKLASVYMAVGNPSAALAEATAILKLNPGLPDVPVTLAEASNTPAQIGASGALLNALPSTAAELPSVLTAKAILLARSGNLPQATALLERAVTSTPPPAAAFSVLGAIFVSRNDMAKAEAAFAKAAELSELRSPRRIQYALFKYQRGDAAAAKQYLAQTFKDAPDFYPAGLRLAEMLIREKKFGEAEALSDQMLSRDGSNHEALALSIRLALARGDTAKALVKANAFVQMYPQVPDAHFEKAKVHMARNELSEAVASLNQVLAINPDHDQAITTLAAIDIQQGNRSAAVTSLRRYLEKNPKNVDAQFLLADAYRGLNDFEAALGVYKVLEQMTPVDQRVHYGKGVTLRALGQTDAARRALELAKSYEPTALEALEQLLEMDVAEKQFDRAQKRLDVALASRPSDAQLVQLMGRLKLVQGQSAEAAALFRKAIELDSNLTSAYMFLAKIYLDTKDSARALESLSQVEKRNPRDTSAILMQGVIHEQQKDYTKARDAYERVLAVNPQFAPALNNLANLYLRQLNDLKKAGELAKRARDVWPADPVIADTAGWTLHKQGDYAAAQTLLLESAAKLSDNAEAQYHLAMNNYMLGNAKAAKAAFEAALRLKGDFPEAAEIPSRLELLKAAEGNVPIATLERYVKENPKDPFALAQLAVRQEQSGNLDTAISTQETVLKLNPQDAKSMTALARMLKAKGEVAKATEYAKAARKLQPENPEVLALTGGLAVMAGEYQAAYGVLSEVARMQPRQSSVALDLSKAALAIGRVAEARAALEQALAVSPDADAKTRLQLIAGLENPGAVREIAERRLGADPDDLAALMIAALTAADSGAAEKLLDRILVKYPDFTPAQRKLAILLSASPANDARTVEVGSKARIAYPADSELAKALGSAVFRQGDYRRASALMETAKGGKATDAEVWYYLGMAQQALKESAKAQASLEKALELGLSGPMSESAKKAIKAING